MFETISFVWDLATCAGSFCNIKNKLICKEHFLNFIIAK